MPRKPKQPRLLPKLEPIRETDDLTFADLKNFSYRCRCGHHAETGIKLEAIVCVKCGSPMQPEPESSTRERNSP